MLDPSGRKGRAPLLATGGLGLARWQIACSRQRILPIEETKVSGPDPARGEVSAGRARYVVEEREAAVLAARSELATASKEMNRHGAVAAPSSVGRAPT